LVVLCAGDVLVCGSLQIVYVHEHSKHFSHKNLIVAVVCVYIYMCVYIYIYIYIYIIEVKFVRNYSSQLVRPVELDKEFNWEWVLNLLLHQLRNLCHSSSPTARHPIIISVYRFRRPTLFSNCRQICFYLLVLNKWKKRALFVYLTFVELIDTVK
jgi:hypothetical protein